MAFLGMRGTGDWATDQREYNWDNALLRIYPNGTAPLTAILGLAKSERTTDPQFHWWTKTLPSQAGAVTGVYTDVLLSSAYVSGGVAGDTLFVKMAAALAGEIRIGHLVRLMDESDLTMTVIGKVTARQVNGTSSYISVVLLEADNNSTSHDLSDCDRLMVVGNVNSEGAAMPEAVTYNPEKWYNYTQIFRTSLEITRTAKLTTLRTDDAYKEMKREALELHGLEREKNYLFGIPSEGIGSNGKPERTTLGLIPAIVGGQTGQASGHAGTVKDFTTDTSYSGQSWLQGGEDFLDTYLEQMFRYGDPEKMALCGNLAVQGINKLVKSGGDYSFTPMTAEYGINVTRWKTPFGSIYLKTHPLFNYEAAMRRSMVIFEPRNISRAYITQTTFYPDAEQKNTGYTRRDGIKEEFLTEDGLKYHGIHGWGYLTGIGSDSAV